MTHDLPTPEDILEELADKVAMQIGRLAPVAFDGAFREMVRYHRFLLLIYASRTFEGLPFSFAEVVGDGWNAPHQGWIRQYRRLFERAADGLPDDSHFLRSLAYAPSRLLPDPGDPQLPSSVLTAILDLGPMMMSRLESWITKRTTVEIPEGQAAEPRVSLAGSDAKAYANVLPVIVGAWEGILNEVPALYGWREEGEQSHIERWSAFRASWPFLWQHLSNTAYSLALAVWNEDERGAAMFREALVRWPEPLRYLFHDYAELKFRRLLYPDTLELDWQAAKTRAASLAADYMPEPTPDQLFASIIRGAHNDAVLLTAALFLFWTIGDKQATPIGGRTARSLLHKETDDDRGGGGGGQPLRFRSLFLDLLRLETAGERFEDASYAAKLNRLVELLDNMTERRVVPGRTYTPSTLHGKEDLVVAFAAILAAAIPDEGDDGLGDRIASLASNEEALPQGDRSLRAIAHELGQLRSALGQPQLPRGVSLLEPDRDSQRLSDRLHETISAAEEVIETKRLARLKARPVDPTRLERVRAAIENALLNDPPIVPFFTDVQVGRVPRGEDAELRQMTFNGIPKAQFTEPPMQSPVSNFMEMFVSGAREMAGNYAWRVFCGRARTRVTVGAGVGSAAFWRELMPMVSKAGPRPTLIVSLPTEGRLLRRFLYSSPGDRPDLRIERRASRTMGPHYIATVEGVDVFGADLPPNEAWLFSAKTLSRVEYAEIDCTGRFAEVTLEVGEEQEGALVVTVYQRLEWAETPIVEVHMTESEGLGEG